MLKRGKLRKLARYLFLFCIIIIVFFGLWIIHNKLKNDAIIENNKVIANKLGISIITEGSINVVNRPELE